ncbi:NAD(P)-dependent oxidoreductase [Gulosibacter sp. 10]|uniref:NAD(P)-dependent oxidoreductase n=1 Tax=Gulosibacter sp. 10 TaxID=1255570 RepID=UPI00097F6ADA|nr:NAD(P)-dependent oxidoreductase [Gulosibacter sp. 10]SJM64018.1 D-3-phosphoglycerate dehydrogenase [Gulosibacter sp. 10]
MSGFTVVGLGPVDGSVVGPLLPEGARFAAEPDAADLAAADAAIVRAAYAVGAAELERMPNVRVLARTGVGVERIDLDAATARGVAVAITPGSGARAVAEGAFTMAAALVKRTLVSHEFVRSGRWARERPPVPGDLAGATMAVIGFGRIGRLIAALADAFGMRVLVHDPFVRAEEYENRSLDEALCEADAVSLHIPGGQGTIVDAGRIARMRPGAVIVNCARAELVDLDAAADALEAGRLGGLGLDVFAVEPPEHHRVFDLENVLLSPHTTGLSAGATVLTLEMAAAAVSAVLRGEAPAAVANPGYAERAGGAA